MALCSNEYRIGLTEADLETGFFFTRNIPAPDTCDYKDYSEIKTHGDGGASKYGYTRLEMTWVNASVKDARKIRILVDAAIDKKRVFLTIDRNDGTGGLYDWIDIYGTPHPLEMVPLGNIAGGVGSGQSSITLKVSAISVLNDPSSVVETP